MPWQVESRACAACFEAPLLLLEWVRGWDTKALSLMGYPCKSPVPPLFFHISWGLLPPLKFSWNEPNSEITAGREEEAMVVDRQAVRLHKLHFLRK